MNRAERRKMMRKIPGYKKALKTASKKAVEDMEKSFQKQWIAAQDETLNEGQRDYNDNSEDEIFNY